MSLTRVCKKPAGRIQWQTQSVLLTPSAEIRVVANTKAGVQAVIIPDKISLLHRMIAMSVGSEANRYSEYLTDLWKLGEVWGAPKYIELLEAMINPPVPRHSLVRIA